LACVELIFFCRKAFAAENFFYQKIFVHMNYADAGQSAPRKNIEQKICPNCWKPGRFGEHNRGQRQLPMIK